MALTIFRYRYWAMVMVLLASCGVVGRFSQRQFVFDKDGKEKKLMFRLPKGKIEENFRVGENGAKEQFYDMGDGSVFYVARHITWPTVNQHRIDAVHAAKPGSTMTNNGKDEDGTYWKEIQLEDFRIGYAYVSAAKLEAFDETLNGIRIKNHFR